MSAVTASVVLYKTPASQLTRLLDCIAQSSISIHTFLVDNSPTQLEYSIGESSSITYIKAESNNGYGAGHNIAMRRTLNSAKFHFVLNPDICFGPSELEKMIGFMEEHAEIGQLMPKVIYPDGTIQYLCKLLPSPADLFFRRFSFGPLRGAAIEKNARYELRFSNYDRTMDVPYLSGCFMLFRTSALRRVGLFDERFFMYPEDIDITRRMHAEFRTVFYPGATIIHDHARDSYKNLRSLGVHCYNSVRYFNKWGWIRDRQRTMFNRRTLERLGYKGGRFTPSPEFPIPDAGPTKES